MNEQLQKWLNGELSEDELKKTVSPDDLLKFKQILEEVDRWVPDNDPLIFHPNEVTQLAKETKTRSIQRWIPLSVAASVLLIASFIWMFVTKDVTRHSTGVAEIKEITLPDGKSIVMLAANSEVSWNKKDWESNNRVLGMKGKALYDVESGSPFLVNSSNGTVEVLGTTFEVDDFQEGMNVICFEGKVRATTTNGESVVANGGESYLYFEDNWEDRIEINVTKPDWLTNVTRFEKAPLIQVIKSLEQHYDLKIVVGVVSLKRRFTGSFPNDNLDTALKLVFGSLDISYQQKGDEIHLSE